MKNFICQMLLEKYIEKRKNFKNYLFQQRQRLGEFIQERLILINN